MEKLVILLFLTSLAGAQTLEVLKVQQFESKLRFQKNRYGGISGLAYADGFLWGISDDRGQFGPPRIYKHSIQDLNIKIEEEVTVKEPSGISVVDYESLLKLKDGSFLISSEGDLNKKPRVFPFVRNWSREKGWLRDIIFPDGFLSEMTGMQTQGLQNNSAFEAMTVNPDESALYLMSEMPLYQNQKSEIEFIEYELKSKNWDLKNRKSYIRGSAPDGAVEIMRGVSEILFWKIDHLLVLERWVRLDKSKALLIGAELFSVDTTTMKKKKIFTLEGNQLAGNWEGMSFGPYLSDGRKLLILVSDNNFENKTPTQFLFLALKE